MTDALLPLAAGVVGVLASFVSTTVHEHWRHRRLLATRWDERKLQATLDFSTSVKHSFRAARTYSLERRRAPEDETAHRELEALIDQADERRSVTFEALILLSTEEARGSADSVNQAWWAYNRLCRQDSVTDHGLKAKEEQLFEQLNKFMRQVQHDLGMNAKPAKSKRTSSA